ncbi:MAG: hypothetical protein R3F65_33345 [bacterium]
MTLLQPWLIGPFSDPDGLVDKYYARITDPAELPDMNRMSPPLPNGVRGSMFGSGKYGWHPWHCDVQGKARVDAVIHRLGPPMTLEWLGRKDRGYMWRHRDPAKPHAGIMLILYKRRVELRDWSESDRARGYSGRVGVAGESEIYRWFDWLTEPLTPGEAASPPAAAPASGGDLAP